MLTHNSTRFWSWDLIFSQSGRGSLGEVPFGGDISFCLGVNDWGAKTVFSLTQKFHHLVVVDISKRYVSELDPTRPTKNQKQAGTFITLKRGGQRFSS